MENETTLTNPDDRYDQLCTECGMGRYHETSIHDDWDGVLHCTNKECNHEVKRYKSDDNPPPKPEKAKLSPAAQAVLDAVINVAESPDAEAIAAAVLRAVVGDLSYLLPFEDSACVDVADLLAIADELEGAN
jgi:hypothetical protein